MAASGCISGCGCGPFYKRAAPFLLALAVLIPALSMLGFYQSGRMVIEADSIEWRAETQSESQIGTRAEAQTLERITDLFPVRLFRPDRHRVAGPRRPRHQRTPPRHDQPLLRQRPDGARSKRPQRARGEPAQQRSARQRLRRPRRAARPAASASSATTTSCRRPRSARRSCSAGSARRILRSASPASCGRPAISRSSSCSCRTTMSADGARSNPTRIGEERYRRQHVRRHARLDRGWRRSGCRSTPCSSSTASSRAVSQRDRASGGQPNQFVGDGMLALFGLSTSPPGRLPPGDARGGDDRRQRRRS